MSEDRAFKLAIPGSNPAAALNRTNINVQELAVKAALEKDRAAVVQAVMFDPLTSALLTPREIERMVNEMFEAEAKRLQF